MAMFNCLLTPSRTVLETVVRPIVQAVEMHDQVHCALRIIYAVLVTHYPYTYSLL